MALTKSKKKEIVEKVSGIAKDTTSLIFVNFHGLSVADSTAMRKTLRNAGIGYIVAKKTLTSKALKDRGFDGEMPVFSGELGMVYPKGVDAKDITAPAREIRAFEKKFEGKLSILGGVFKSRFISKEEMIAIASIPSKHVLLGMFVNLINSPIQRFAVVLDQVSKTKTA